MIVSSDPRWIWRQYAPGCYLLEASDGQTVWVFGLRWLPTISARSRKLLLAQLHREKVRWWSTPTVHSRTIGFLPLMQSTQTPRVDTRLRCAAAQFALRHPKGAHLLRLTLGRGLHWIVAVNDGNVLCQTDCWLDSDSTADQLEQSISQRFDQVHVTRCVMSEESLYADSGLDFLLDGQVPTQACLKRLRAPLPLRIGGLVLLVLAVSSWWVWSGQKARALNTEQSSIEGLNFEGQSQSFELRVSRHGDLSRIADLWADLPINPTGWLLQGVSCPIVSEQAICRARYKRIAPDSSNLQLQAVMATGWHMLPMSLDQTEFIGSVPINPVRLTESRAVAQTPSWLVQLQQISGLTYTVDLGTPLPSGAGRQSHPVRSLRIVLPLKHLGVIDALPISVVWSAIHLEIAHVPAQQPEATRLLTYLEGELFEQS